MPAKSPFGDCGGNITDSENGIIKSPNYPEKYTTNDQSESSGRAQAPSNQPLSNVLRKRR
jgi:hypothetical protein